MTRTDRQIIIVAATERGAERVRITRNGEVHAYGKMPNSIVTGWYLLAQDAAALLADIKAGHR